MQLDARPKPDGDPVGIRWSLEDLADVTAEEGDIERSLEIYEQALSFARQTGDLHAIGSILQSKGALARGAGNVESARALIGEGLGIMHRIGCWHCCARYLGDLAFVMGASGEPERAVRLLGAAEALRERTGIIIRPKALAVIEKALSDARQSIGEAACADALNQGRALSLPAAIKQALATGDPV